MGQSLSIQVLKGGQVQGQLEFDSDAHRTIKIGRLNNAQVKLEDPKVARIHAVIEFSGVDASLVDMGSTQGTAVNGSKISKVKLNHGDQVTVGDTVLVCGFGGAAVQAPAAPAAVAAAAAAPAAVAPGQRAAFAGTAQLAGAGAAGGTIPVGGAMRSAQPNFDPGHPDAHTEPVRRITQERLRGAAVDSKPHPGLTPEDPLTRDNRVLELRFYWGEVLLGMYHYVQPPKVTIGESKQADIFLSSEGLPVEQFPLIRYKDGDYLLSFTSSMEGEYEAGGQSQSLKDVAAGGGAAKDSELANTHNLKLADESRALLHWGGATFAMRFVPPAKVTKPPFGKNIDLNYITAMSFSLLFHIAAIITLSIYPHDTEALKVDLFGEPDRFASLILEAPKETKSTKDMLDKIKKKVEETKLEQKPKEEKKEQPKVDLNKKPDLSKMMPAPKKTEEQKKQEVANKFKQLFQGGGGGSLLGGGGGGSLSGTLQGVIGTAGAGSSTAGLAGLGIRGTGPLTGGGIGTSRGIAGIGTTGRLGGGGLGYGAGVGLLGGGRSKNLIDLDTPQIEGALPPEVIKKVINENKNQVRYCYEVELQRNQNLEGRVEVKWIIGATGAVATVSIKNSTIKNANVEQCLMGKIRTWKFPPPAGGGTVEVNYPFVFKAS